MSRKTLEVANKNATVSKNDTWWKILISIFVLGIAGFLFSRYPTAHGGGWYHQLKQPDFAPPYWLPFVMWSVVYILMGSSVGIIWHHAVNKSNPLIVKSSRKGIFLFIIHLIFNLIFPLILIGYHLPVISLIDISILVLLIIALIWKFHPISKTAAWLLMPYLVWIIYATLLNAAILVLN